MIKVIDDILVTDSVSIPGTGGGCYFHRKWIKKGIFPKLDLLMSKYKKFDKFIIIEDIKNKAILEHELSHARRMGDSNKLYMASKTGLAPYILGATGALLTKKKRWAALASLIGSSPMLIEEGRANYDSYKKAKDLGLVGKSMGAYMLVSGIHAIPGMAIASLAKKKQ